MGILASLLIFLGPYFFMSAPCNGKFILPVHLWPSFVELIIAKGLEGLDFIHFKCLGVNSIHVIDCAYLQYEYDITA